MCLQCPFLYISPHFFNFFTCKVWGYEQMMIRSWYEDEHWYINNCCFRRTQWSWATSLRRQPSWRRWNTQTSSRWPRWSLYELGISAHGEMQNNDENNWGRPHDDEWQWEQFLGNKMAGNREGRKGKKIKRDTGEKQNQNYLNGQRRGGGVKKGMGRE